MSMNWFNRFLFLAILAMTSLSRFQLQAQEAKRPNILFCISDDQSWLHTSIGGDNIVKTPHFDRVAKEGLLFRNAFTSCPSCAPSRAAILTGQDFWRLEEGGLLMGRLKTKFKIYTRLLLDSGYQVGFTGKGYQPGATDYRRPGPTGDAFAGKKSKPLAKGMNNNDYAGNFDAFLEQRDKSKPFCFWYGGTEPHRKYEFKSGAKSGMKLENVKVPPFFADSEDVRHDILDYYLEIQWFDTHLGRMLKTLEEAGALENTLVIVTSDNGMPFPRAKATAYNYGVHMPLAIRWGGGINKPGRVIYDFVNHTDFAPTFLQAAGLPIPEEMTGQSLMPLFQTEKDGWVEDSRQYTVSGLERHVWARPKGVCYPRRVIHTKEYVYIRNYEPERWPMGCPDFTASHQGFFGDIDAGPTKTYMMAHKTSEADKKAYDMSFGKLPAEELYAIETDPEQLVNLAGNPERKAVKEKLSKQLQDHLTQRKDPRALGQSPWDDYPFNASQRYLKAQGVDTSKWRK